MFFKKFKTTWIYIVLLLSMIQGCDPEVNHTVETIITNPQITVHPLNPAFSEKDTINFHLFHPGSQKVKWELVSKPKWLSVDRAYGEVNNEGTVVKATVRQDLVQKGDYFANISFVSEGAGFCEASLALFAEKNPDPYFNPTELIFNENESKKTIELLNKGKGALVHGVAVPEHDWITISDFESYIYPQDHEVVNISINRKMLEPGITKSNIIFYYNHFRDSINIPLIAHIPEIKDVEFATDTLFFYSKDEPKVLMFNNIGNVGFEWELESSSPQLICETTSGNIKINDFTTVKIKVDRKNLQNGEFNFSLTLKDKEGNFVNSIPVLVRNFVESIATIEGDIVDAKYNKSLDRLIMITQNPNELIVYNIEDHTCTKLNLPSRPTSLAFSADEKFASVGYNEGFSYINLETNIEEFYYDLPFDCHDQVITSEGRIFFSNSSHSNSINYFDIKDHSLHSLKNYNYDFQKVKLYLHPLEKYLFTTKSFSTSTSIKKYDIYEDSLIYDAKWSLSRLYRK